MKQDILFDTVDAYNKLHGLETLHPLVSVIDMTNTGTTASHAKYTYGIYALFLKMGKCCDMLYGRRKYDYQDGTIVSFAPGQVVEVDMIPTNTPTQVKGLIFHPDLIRGTSLGQTIKNYRFFEYSSSEALHLSEREHSIVIGCFEKIQMELEHAIDQHSRKLISMNIELLLNYCQRFYERQFITREVTNNDIVAKFEQYLNEYLDDTANTSHGLPTVKYFAEKVFLSPNYFGDLIKKETGKSAQEYIQYKLIERSKDRIMGSNLSISEIAYELGFQYPQHFGRLFKKLTGATPTEYRTQN